MTPEEIEEAGQSFLAERIAILIHDGGMPEKEAIGMAEACWLKYRKDFRIYGNEQKEICR